MNHRAYSQKAPESQLHEFKLLKPTALFWLCNCGAWLCRGTWCPLQAIGECSGCLRLSLVPFPECNFSPWRKLVKVLRWSEVMRSMEETDECLDFLTPTGGREIIWDCVGNGMYISHTQTRSQMWKSAFGFLFSISAIPYFHLKKDGLFLSSK